MYASGRIYICSEGENKSLLKLGEKVTKATMGQV
jgi:hypothetical protein